MPRGASRARSMPATASRWSRGRWRSSGASCACFRTPSTTACSRVPVASRAGTSSAALLGKRVDVVHPENVLRPFRRGDIEIDHHRLLAAPQENALQRLVGAGVHLLVRHERRHPDEVARPRFGGEFEALAPAHARPALYHADHAPPPPLLMP